MGAQGEAQVVEFVQRLLDGAVLSEPDPTGGVDPTDEAALRTALETDPANAALIVALASLLVDDDRLDEAETLLGRIPETAETRHLMARIRTAGEDTDDITGQLETLLGQVKSDEDARQRFVDLLELLGPDDPRTKTFRRRLATALF